MTDSQNIRVTSSSLRLDRPTLADEMLSMMRPDSTVEDLVTAAKAYEVLKKQAARRMQEKP